MRAFRSASALTVGVVAMSVLAACATGSGTGTKDKDPASSKDPGSVSGGFDWKRFDGSSLSVYIADEGEVDMVRERLPEFERLTGIKVKLETSDVTTYRKSLPVKLTARSADFDVMATFPAVDGPQFSQNGWYVPLDKYLSNGSLTSPDYDFEDFAEGARKSMQVGGKTVTVLWEMQTDLMYYRADLLEKAGLEVPTTFQGWADAAAKVHDPSAGVYGFALRGIPYQTTTPYSSFLYAYCGQWVKDGKAAINSPEALAAWEMYGKMGHAYGPPGITGFDWNVPSQQFQQGKVFAFLDINLFVPELEDASKSRVAGKVGYAPVPDGPCGKAPFVGGWGYAISPFAKNADAAWYFIQWATSKDMNLGMKLTGWPSARSSAWTATEFTAKDPTPKFTQVVLESLKAAKAVMNPPVAPGVEAREIAGQVGNKALAGVAGAELKKAADAQNAKLQDLIDKMGR